ncbi:MAG: ATP-binding protein [Desulfobacteraceae bacterium]|nr:ATP-binding protein [Desulfobacteraceae bacterium]
MIGKENKAFLPSQDWLTLTEKTKNDLITAEKHNHKGLKKEAWETFHQSLQELEKITLKQSDIWKADYLKAIRQWLKESEKQLENLKLELQLIEPITRNIYRSGEALQPKEFGKETFIGREDLRDELSFRILSSAIMPTILLQGQRRVGKTSLLNFLPELLGTRFLIIPLDFQSSECFSLPASLNSFIKKTEQILNLKTPHETLPQDPLEAWYQFEQFFQNIARQENRKIILAFDEYENFHRLLTQETEKGERLLEAMRSFSQRQNNIVFLFTGLLIFSDLGEPDFSRYFVQNQRIKVDFLKKEDSQKLITNPYQGFNVTYPTELVEKIYSLTLGHPALLQQICFEMVNLANKNNKKQMTPTDFQTVLEIVLDRNNAVMTNFWVHFCHASLKQTVTKIMNRQQPDNNADILRLLDYGFVVEDEMCYYKLRVPLFEQWIKKHGESFGK